MSTQVWQVLTENGIQNIAMILLAAGVATLLWVLDQQGKRAFTKRWMDVLARFATSFLAAFFATWLLLDSGGIPTYATGFTTVAGAATGGTLFLKSIWTYADGARIRRELRRSGTTSP